MRVLFLGSPGPLSLAPLERLLAAGFELCGVALLAPHPGAPAVRTLPPTPQPPIPLVGSGAGRTIAHAAWERGAPALQIGSLDAAEALAALAALRPDVACVSCWARRIPPALLALPPRGFLNLHPSLLPRHRGPAPLFWALREGAPLGVTVHLMDARFDTGPILTQAPLDAQDGASGAELDALCGDVGGRLMAEALAGLAAGTLSPRPQPPGGSYEGIPRPEDFSIDRAWSARRAFRFMRGTEEWGEPYSITAGGEALLLRRARGYTLGEQLPAPVVRDRQRVRVQLGDGVLDALVTERAIREWR
jgi:methionyl-tRNA formyltransferase